MRNPMTGPEAEKGGRHVLMNCSLCRRIKDERWKGAVHDQWCDLMTYLKRYQANVAEVRLSESCCPDCTLSYDRLMTYGHPTKPV